MAWSEVRSFTEPAEYAAAIQGLDVELSPSAPGPFAGGFTRVRFESLSLLRTKENQPRVARLTPRFAAGFLISFQIESDANVYESGALRAQDNITQISMDQPFFQRSDKAANHGSLFLPPGVMESVGLIAADREIMPPRKHTISTPRPGAMAKLRGLHRAVGSLAEESPDVLAHAEVARGLEQALIEAMAACLDSNDNRKDGSAHWRHAAIMRRFQAALEADPGRAFYVLEIAKAIGVSVRCLSACCQEHLGMGPKHYLQLRRMHLARQTLSVADPRLTTVTEVATHYGFWQLGRFAVEYKSLFGESPSVTLRRQRA